MVNIFDISKNTDLEVKYSWDTQGFKFQLDPVLPLINRQEASDGGTLRRLSIMSSKTTKATYQDHASQRRQRAGATARAWSCSEEHEIGYARKGGV